MDPAPVVGPGRSQGGFYARRREWRLREKAW